ncbi:PilN domain-containing protein [Persephonella sp. KM09-Lau-8]|uniref:PilN domain-containing protein n=1 Tax=Persephonella sp. KM09-Lau-8 TaxID=1158345 RepID=UPI0004954714|nr:PilN domain-containing protein [Persephonella sp. KM09-Lau-8]
MIKVNLNPEKRKPKAVKKGISAPSVKANKGILYIGIPALLVAAEIVYIVYLNGNISTLSQKKQTLIQERAKYKDVERQINRLKKAVVEAEKLKETTKLKIAVFNKLASSKTDFIPMIKAIALSLPDGVWLKKMEISRSSGNLNGFSFNPKYISNFYDNLSQYYTEIKFKSVKKQVSKNKNVKYYAFNFRLNNWKKQKKEEKQQENKNVPNNQVGRK